MTDFYQLKMGNHISKHVQTCTNFELDGKFLFLNLFLLVEILMGS